MEERMKITRKFLGPSLALLLLVTFSLTTPSLAQDAPLADQARQMRKDKDKPRTQVRTFDNDNLPREDKLSIVGNPVPAADVAAQQATSTNPDSSAAPATASTAATASADNHSNSKDGAAKQQAEWQRWKDRIIAQKEQIELLQRELDVTEREAKLRAAAAYADAGNRLRNSVQWDKQDTDYKQQLEVKKKALDSAKETFEDMQEQARKAGVPPNMREP